MKSVVLSSTEAEYIGVSEVVKELKFVIQLLETIDIKIELPIKVQVDNVGAMWLANNYSSGERTRYIDIRAHFVKGFVVDGVIELIFVMSQHNDSDLFTKNLPSAAYQRHSAKLIWTMDEMNNPKHPKDQ